MAANNGKPPASEISTIENQFLLLLDQHAEPADLSGLAKLLLELARAQANGAIQVKTELQISPAGSSPYLKHPKEGTTE